MYSRGTAWKMIERPSGEKYPSPALAKSNVICRMFFKYLPSIDSLAASPALDGASSAGANCARQTISAQTAAGTQFDCFCFILKHCMLWLAMVPETLRKSYYKCKLEGRYPGDTTAHEDLHQNR